MTPVARLSITLLLLTALAGCASFPEARPLERVDPASGYRYANLEGAPDSEELFVILSFSGGGTRAAALAYGVLERLRDSWVEMNGESRNLLDEVDVISSVSGGSFTAAYYGLHGDAIFEEGGRFERDFLYRDVEADLRRRLFNPYNWVRLASPTFGRIELAEEVYQALLFDEASFADLAERGQKPFLLINATDMDKGAQFTFVQSQLDPMCVDLDSVSLSRAVAASSNFPVAFTPLALNSYPGRCGYQEPPWVANALEGLETNPRRYYRARNWQRYQEPDRDYVHLLDGGVSDNIGLRPAHVDAKPASPAADFDTSPRAPGPKQVINTIASTPLVNYSFDTVELIRETLRDREDAQRLSRETGNGLHQVDLYYIYVGFDRLTDPAERERFQGIPTRFRLPAEEVDALRRIGARLLEESPCFQALLGQAEVPEGRFCRY
ncbi:patatin-like phospholipase family protein [Halomonas sp. BM-2019]|uniref:patatin-like phospholipase family protein n=1 Tax=Halomonas sp. BM-2019 TaxID=2811227 RepID=UPI001B3C329C|nr:MAG: patatin-like phospholipase family protein [Halomonas sp. BM-2019]